MASTAGALYIAHERHERGAEVEEGTLPQATARPATSPLSSRAVMDAETVEVLAHICHCTVAEFVERYSRCGA